MGIGVQQGSLYLEQVLGAYREAAQTKVQVLRRVGGVAHGKAAYHFIIAVHGGKADLRGAVFGVKR